MALKYLAYIYKAVNNKPTTSAKTALPVSGAGGTSVAQASPAKVQARSDDAAAIDLQQSDQRAVMEIRESDDAGVIEVVPTEPMPVIDLPEGGETAVIDLLQKEEDAVIDLLQTEIESLHTHIAEARTGGAALDQAAPDNAQLRREVDALHAQLTRAIQQLGWERERADILNREAIARIERGMPSVVDSFDRAEKERLAEKRREQERLAQEKREQERLERLARLEQRFAELSKDVIVELSLERKSFLQRLRRR